MAYQVRSWFAIRVPVSGCALTPVAWLVCWYVCVCDGASIFPSAHRGVITAGRYYKGLGTSTAAEGREYFSRLPRHHRTFTWTSTSDDDLIEMAFAKSQVSRRKEWLSASADADESPDFSSGDVTCVPSCPVHSHTPHAHQSLRRPESVVLLWCCQALLHVPLPCMCLVL